MFVISESWNYTTSDISEEELSVTRSSPQISRGNSLDNESTSPLCSRGETNNRNSQANELARANISAVIDQSNKQTMTRFDGSEIGDIKTELVNVGRKSERCSSHTKCDNHLGGQDRRSSGDAVTGCQFLGHQEEQEPHRRRIESTGDRPPVKR